MHKYAKIALLGTLILFNTSVYATESYLLGAISIDNVRVQKVYSTFSSTLNNRLSEANSYLSDSSRAELEQLSRKIEQKFVLLTEQVKKQDRAGGMNTIAEVKQLSAQALAIVRLAKTNKETTSTPLAPVTSTAASNTTGTAKTADILYYADNFEGAGTSGGNKFSQSIFSSANCEAPFHTLIQVVSGGKSVIVKNNDRPNCRLHPDMVDLSTIAFKTLAPISRGRLKGEYYMLGSVPANFSKQYIPTTLFSVYNVSLSEDTPNIFFPGETLHVSGRVLDGKPQASVFLESPEGKRTGYAVQTENDAFGFKIPMTTVGRYRLVVTSGLGFKGSAVAEILVIDPKVVNGKKYVDSKYDAIDGFTLSREDFGESIFNVVDLPSKQFNEIVFRQGQKEIRFSGMGDVAIPVGVFDSFDYSAPVEVTVYASLSTTGFSHDTYTVPGVIFSKSYMLNQSMSVVQKEKLAVSMQGDEVVIRGSVNKGSRVSPKMYIILPSGKVRSYSFEADDVDASTQLLKTDTLVELRIPTSEKGQYVVEINYDTGYAAVNVPVANSVTLPLLSNSYDSLSKKGITSMTAKTAQDKSLELLNAMRSTASASKLEQSITLNKLAMIKAQDMADHDYVGHVDSTGVKILGTAKRSKIDIASSTIGENVAGGTMGLEALFAELSMSAGHRANMIDDWTGVGFGYVEKNGQAYYVQVFGK